MSKVLQKIAIAASALPGMLIVAARTFAFEGGLDDINPDIIGPQTLDEFVQNALTISVSVAAVIAVVFMIVNGIKYITSAGESAKTEEAQKGIIAALIGLIVVGVAYLIVRFVVTRILGVDDPSGLDTMLLISLS
jgi:hypothetical protein